MGNKPCIKYFWRVYLYRIMPYKNKNIAKLRMREKRENPSYRQKEKLQRQAKMSTPAEKIRRQKYKQTEKGKISNTKYKKSDKGRLTYLKSHLKRRYNLTVDEYNSIMERQNYRCDMCGELLEGSKISLDHNHTTNKVRGIVHQSCNWIIGVLETKSDLIILAQVYLKKHI